MSYYLWIDNIYKKYTNHSISEATTWKKEYYFPFKTQTKLDNSSIIK